MKLSTIIKKLKAVAESITVPFPVYVEFDFASFDPIKLVPHVTEFSNKPLVALTAGANEESVALIDFIDYLNNASKNLPDTQVYVIPHEKFQSQTVIVDVKPIKSRKGTEPYKVVLTTKTDLYDI